MESHEIKELSKVMARRSGIGGSKQIKKDKRELTRTKTAFSKLRELVSEAASSEDQEILAQASRLIDQAIRANEIAFKDEQQEEQFRMAQYEEEKRQELADIEEQLFEDCDEGNAALISDVIADQIGSRLRNSVIAYRAGKIPVEKLKAEAAIDIQQMFLYEPRSKIDSFKIFVEKEAISRRFSCGHDYETALGL